MKDFHKLQEYLKKNKEIKTKDAIALGYSNYDLKTFLESSLLEKKGRGVYTLNASQPEEVPSITLEPKQAPLEAPSIPTDHEPEEVPSVPAKPQSCGKTYAEIKQMNYEAIGHIFSKDYDTALSQFKTLSSLIPQNGYYNMGISYVYFLKEDYQSALDNLLLCIDKQGEHQSSLVPYLILRILSKYVDVEPEVITRVAAKVNLSLVSRNFKYKIYRNIEKDNYPAAQKALYFYIKAESAEHKYLLGNRYLYEILEDIMDKLGLEHLSEINSSKEPVAAPVETQAEPIANPLADHPVEPVVENVVVVPEINPKQILTTSILLEALDSGDYDTALRQVEEYEITDSKALIIALINKLKESKERGANYLSGPTKVVSEEPAVVINAQSEDLTIHHMGEEVVKEAPVAPEAPVDRIVPAASEETIVTQASQAPEEQIVPEAPKSTTAPQPSIASAPIEATRTPEPAIQTPEDLYNMYSDAMECCDFDTAKRALFKYDTMLKQSSNYQNLAYLFDRINRAKIEYAQNPTKYKAKIATLNKVYSLMIRRHYDEALEVISSLPACEEKYLLSAELNQLLGNNDLASRNIRMLPNDCHEPDYYRVLAELSFTSFAFQECLNYCVKYNECLPKENARIYILMADCYEKLKKPAKAAKVLRIADEINRANGSNKNLSGRISYNEQAADKNRAKRLAILNRKEYDN